MKHPFLIIGLCLFITTVTYAVFADTASVLLPTADGTNDSAQWTNTAGTPCNSANCALEVDEPSGAYCLGSDGDTSYIQSSTLGAQQTFSLDISSIPNGSTITQMDIFVCHKRMSTPPNLFQTRKCVDGACVDSGIDITATASYASTSQSYIGLNISKTATTQLEAGISLTGKKGTPVRLSRIFSTITYTPPTTPSSPSSGGGPGGSPATMVRFSGTAYPSSTVEVLTKSLFDETFRNIPAEDSSMSPDGVFSNTYIGLLGGNYIFGLRAYDRDGRKTGIVSFNADLLFKGQVDISNIFFPPTVGFEKETVLKGDDVHIVGYAGAGNTVQLKIGTDTAGEAIASDTGFYEFFVSTKDFGAGRQYVKVRRIANFDDQKDKVTSDYSAALPFRVSTCCIRTDFNADNEVNVTDWSIFLFRWESKDTALHASVDLNGDGEVNIIDFSLFLKSITTTRII